MESCGGVFQLRPHKDFVAAKGRDRLLSLRLLSELPCDDVDASASEISSASEPKNAYEFMKKRRELGTDPSLKRWNASIRLSNFTSIENSPLCASIYVLVYISLITYGLPIYLDLIHRSAS